MKNVQATSQTRTVKDEERAKISIDLEKSPISQLYSHLKLTSWESDILESLILIKETPITFHSSESDVFPFFVVHFEPEAQSAIRSRLTSVIVQEVLHVLRIGHSSFISRRSSVIALGWPSDL